MTTDDVYALAKYPYVILAGVSHDVYMQINTSCGSDWVGPKELYLMDPNPGGGGPTPIPTPKPGENHPPVATISWVKAGTTTPTGIVAQGSKIDLIITSMSDPDYPDDWVEVQSWNFTDSTDWLKTVPDQFGGNIKQNSYNNITAAELGAHKVAMTVVDLKGATYTAYATLNVADSKPVAIITAPLNVKEGRALPSPIHGNMSYSPIGLQLVEYVWTNKLDKYMTPGVETVTLKVRDEENHWSDLATKNINVLPDNPPIDTLSVPEESTRLNSVTILSNAYSPDYDTIISHKMEMKYDAANDGFANDAWQTVVNGNGDADSFTFTPSRVGKYLFQETVCEDYGKCGNTDGQAVAERTLNVVNIAPIADVKANSDLSDPPESTPILMSDLFNTGRFFNLNNSVVGDKSSWEIQNGILKTKVRTPLGNISEAHTPIMQKYEDNGSRTGIYFTTTMNNGNMYGVFAGTTFGFDNPNAIPFQSAQSSLSTSKLEMGLPGRIISWTEDEKYTYVQTTLNYDPQWGTPIDSMLYAYNKDFTVKWSKNIVGTPSMHLTSNYQGHNHPGQDSRILSHHGRLYFWTNSTTSGMNPKLIALDRETGTQAASVDIASSDVAYWSDIVAGVSDGIIVGFKKYDFDLNPKGVWFNANMNLDYHPVAFSQRAGTAVIASNGNTNEGLRVVRTTDGALVGGPYSGTSYDTPRGVFGFDNAGNVYSSDWGNQNIWHFYKISLNGISTRSQDVNEYANPFLGMDLKNRIWTGGLNSTTDVYTNNYVVKVFSADGTLVKKFDLDVNTYNIYDYMFVGTDGLVTLWGIVRRTDGYHGIYAVIDPDTFSTVTKGETALIHRYYVPTYIHPHGNQSFVIEVRDGYSNENAQFLVSTNGAMTKPMLLEVGDSTPDLNSGPSVAATQTLKASLKAAAPDGKGTGIAFRIRDDRNYYSVEWEASELRVKKTVNSTASIVWSKAFPMVANQVYDVKIVPGSNTFDVYVNRLFQATINESVWKDGKFGIINRSQQDVSFLGASTETTPAGYGQIDGIALVSQQVNYTLSYADEESDPQLTASSTWVYTHNPNALLQPLGTASFSGQTLNAPVTSFPYPGDYTFTYKTKDDPHPSHRYPDTAFSTYRQESNTVTGKIRVHRRPIADFTATWNSNGTIAYADASYDPDRYNPANGSFSTENTGINYQATRGVLEYRYRYRAAGSTTYIELKPAKLFGGTYIIELSVRDEYNAWSDWATQTIVAGGSTPLPPNPGFTIAPTTQYRFTAVTFNSTASDPQDGARENVEHAYYIKNVTTGGPESLQSDVRTSWMKEFSSLGVFQVRQIVINSFGLYAEATRNVSIVNRKPAADLTEPASTNAASPTIYETLRPAFKWTYSDGDGDPQTQYQLHFYKADGTFYRDSGTIGGSDLAWTPAADFADNATYYAYVRVMDGMDWSNWSAPHYFRIATNKPPTADLTWTPSPVWEGDTVKLLPTLSDPDGDRLDVVYEIESPSGVKRTVNEQRMPPYGGAGPTFVAITPGNWKVRLTVSDGKAPAVAVVKTILVAPLGVTGQVLHTAAWEDNRQRYNADHPGKERPAHWFWAGEQFVLEAATTDTGASSTKAATVTAEAGPRLKAALQAVIPGKPIAWKGELGSEQFGGPLKELPEGDYAFEFTAVYTNGVVKKSSVVVRVTGTVDGFVNVHRVQ
ncbi:hypothetical protein [Cohnella hashimotonis]|uniref:Uncharacterized protein n=1 Tax=Cohnella hashimotonis TaxID=2826895 RepID=A0ABT6TC45_9BACL|nr:hypothetical protein [Cohnella hashimotonis]MDI4644398.1 hypothetical protein [Cohnella hashimotonis]